MRTTGEEYGGTMSNDPRDQTDDTESDGDNDAEDETQTDPRVSSVPLTTEDGSEVVIAQQNVGPGNRVGAGEFKKSDETSSHKSPSTAAAEQEELESEAPVE